MSRDPSPMMLHDIVLFLERIERHSRATNMPAVLRADLGLAARLIDALIVKANIKDWPLDISNEALGRRGHRERPGR
jgi:hypothetical protein